MRAGPLRNRLAFQAATESAGPASAGGERTKTWATRITVWGSVEPLSSRELFTTAQVAPRATHKITVRGGGTTPTARERILFGARVFHIEGKPMDKDERGILVTLLACEVSP